MGCHGLLVAGLCQLAKEGLPYGRLWLLQYRFREIYGIVLLRRRLFVVPPGRKAALWRPLVDQYRSKAPAPESRPHLKCRGIGVRNCCPRRKTRLYVVITGTCGNTPA